MFKLKARYVFWIIWLVVAIAICIIGIASIIFAIVQDGFGTALLGAWMFSGMLSLIPMLPTVFSVLVSGTRDGMESGADTYSASIYGNHIYVNNHPITGFIFGLIGTLLGCIVAGLPFLIVRIYDEIPSIRFLHDEIKERSNNNY